jgi:hypothetical protein
MRFNLGHKKAPPLCTLLPPPPRFHILGDDFQGQRLYKKY